MTTTHNRAAADAEVLEPATAADVAALDRLAPDAPDGGRAPLQRQSTAWLADGEA